MALVPFDFPTVFSTVDENGMILEMQILNHGSNYTFDPSVVASDPHCMCNLKVRRYPQDLIIFGTPADSLPLVRQ
jgi:hypothetical protein